MGVKSPEKQYSVPVIKRKRVHSDSMATTEKTQYLYQLHHQLPTEQENEAEY